MTLTMALAGVEAKAEMLVIVVEVVIAGSHILSDHDVEHDVEHGVGGGGGQGGDVGNSSGSGDCRQPYIERP